MENQLKYWTDKQKLDWMHHTIQELQRDDMVDSEYYELDWFLSFIEDLRKGFIIKP